MKARLLTGALATAVALQCAGAVLRPETTEVVIPKTAPKTVQFAAGAMTNFLSRAFGREIPVVAVRTPGHTALILGDSAESRAAGIDVSKLARDEYVLRADADAVCIVGRDDPKVSVEWVLNHGGKMSMHFEHATAMGVYGFLERHAGVRFYFPGELGEIVPKREQIDVPTGETRVRPDFTARY